MHQKSPRNEHEKIWIPVSQWSKRTPSTDLRKCIKTRSFFVVPGVALLTPCMQKSLKIIQNSPQNDHKKYEARCCNDQKHTPSTDLRKCSETRSFLSFPVLLCSRHGCRIRSKLSKIIDGGMSCVDGRARRVSLAVPLRRTTLRSARREAGQFEVYFDRKNNKNRLF